MAAHRFGSSLPGGGGVMVSELNTKGDFNKRAYMSWFLNQVAKGTGSVTLPINRSQSEASLTETLPRHEDHFMILDMNPESSYGNRYPLNQELDALTGYVYLNGEYDEDDFRKLIQMRLSEVMGVEIDPDQRNWISDVLSEVHQTMARELRLEGGRFMEESSRTVLTLRELLDRSIGSILGDLERGGVDPKRAVLKAIRNYYLSFFDAPDEYQAAIKLIDETLKRHGFTDQDVSFWYFGNRRETDQVLAQIDETVEEALLNSHLARAPPVHLRYAVDSDGAELIRRLVDQKNDDAGPQGPRWHYERKDLTAFTDAYDLKGDFIPSRSSLDAEDADRLLQEYATLSPALVDQAGRALRMKNPDAIPTAVDILSEMHALELSKRWNPELIWTEAFLVRKIKEAQQALAEASGDVSQADRIVVEMSQYQLLDPEIGIMLNDFFLSGRLYLPGGREPLIAPKNLILMTSSSGKLNLSPAENSRQVRFTLYEYSESAQRKKLSQALLHFKGFRPDTRILKETVDELLIYWKFFNGESDILGTVVPDNSANRKILKFLQNNSEYQAFQEQVRFSDKPARSLKEWMALAEKWSLLRKRTNSARARDMILDYHVHAMFGIGTQGQSFGDQTERASSLLLETMPAIEMLLDFTVSATPDGVGLPSQTVMRFIRSTKELNRNLGSILALIDGREDDLFKIPTTPGFADNLKVGDFVKIEGKLMLYLGNGPNVNPLLLFVQDGQPMVREFTLEGPVEVLSKDSLDREVGRLFLEYKKAEAERVNRRTDTVFGKLRYLKSFFLAQRIYMVRKSSWQRLFKKVIWLPFGNGQSRTEMRFKVNQAKSRAFGCSMIIWSIWSPMVLFSRRGQRCLRVVNPTCKWKKVSLSPGGHLRQKGLFAFPKPC